MTAPTASEDPRDPPRLEPLPALGEGRMGIFVPAIMSVGLLFWIVTLVRDLFRWRGRRELDRRTRLAGVGAASFVAGRPPTVSPVRSGLRRRRSYLLTGVVLSGIAVYVLVGSALNYARAGGYVGDLAWLLGLALLVAIAFGFAGGVAATVFLFWPDPPRAITRILVNTPLTRTPRRPGDDPDDEPAWGLSVGALLVPLAAAVVTVVVAGAPERLRSVDGPTTRWVTDVGHFDLGRFVDPTTQPVVAVALAALVALAAWRCRPLAVAGLVATPLAAVAALVARLVADRVGPGATGAPSFPDGATAVAVAATGLIPLALGILLRRDGVAGLLRVPSAVLAAAVGLARIDAREAWLTDVIGGALIGAGSALAVEWAVGHRRWHDSCRGCPWAPPGEHPKLLARIALADRRRVVRSLAHLSALVAVAALTALTLSGTVPANDEGALLGSHIQRPVQLALAGLVSIGALVSWRFPGAGAVLIAVAGAGLGVFAGLEYRPEVAILMTLGLLVPAFLLWLSWQHRRSRAEIVALAVLSVALVAATWVGAGRVYDDLFGPTHPDSAAADRPMDRVRWMWSGGLAADRVTVVAGVSPGSERARLRLRPAGGGAEVWTPSVRVDADDLVRLEAADLRADTRYSVVVEVDGHLDEGRGRGRVRTPAVGPMSFTVAVGACARVASNGGVFDQIARQDPLFFLGLGDLHYGNLDATEPGPFREAWARLLTRPGPAALFRDVPLAYTWDDHDYGPNDADATSPSRDAARRAYRQMVPHGPLASDGPIAQAFTVGRVRFVLTDTRSERTTDTMLGTGQLEWLIDELVTSSRTHAVVVWANAVPWVGAAAAGSDSWAGYPAERRRIADALAAAEVDNLVMVSGDAHMVAIDDGTNTGYSTTGRPGFPLLHAAALDRPGGVKGGPYSEGTFPGGGQFGLVEVDDDGGDRVTVRLRGMDWRGRELVSLSVPVGVPAEARVDR